MSTVHRAQADSFGGDAVAPRLLPVSGQPHGSPNRAFGLLKAGAEALDERRLFVLLPFAIITGLIVSLAGTRQPEPVVLIAGACVLAIAGLIALRSLAASHLVAVLAAFWLGLALLSVHGALYGTEMLARPAYGTYDFRVDQVLATRPDGQRVVVSAIAPVENARDLPVRRARLAIREGPMLAPGDHVRGPVRFYPVPGPVLPDAFDTQFHAYFDGIGAYGATTRPPQIATASDPAGPEHLINELRQSIGARIDEILEQPSAGIARALITGDQSKVDETARDTMATAGLAHVLSISGLHLTLVAGGVFVALRMALAMSEGLARRVPVKRLAAAGGIVAALLYFSISGGSVAAVRATIMIILVLGAVVAGRRALTMRNVAIAALVVLLTDPASVFRPSFQLSFAAVVALIGAWELARQREREFASDRGLVRQVLGYFGGIAVTSFVAGAATLLFSIYHFQQTSPLGILGNLVSLPLVAFVMMPSAVLAMLAIPFGFETPFLLSMGWSIDRMLGLARLVESLSGGIDASPLLTPLALVFGLAALAWFAFLRSWHRLIGPAVLIPAVVLFALDRPPDVLIADTTQAVAARLDDDLVVVAGRANTFAVDVWRETYGDQMPAADIACDSIACVATSARGFRLAIARDPAGLFEECGVDLIISRRETASTCGTSTVIGGPDLASGGVHWLRWDDAARQFTIRRAIPDGDRPWRRPF